MNIMNLSTAACNK